MGCLGCLLWPFHLVWGVFGFVLSLVGHVFGAVLGILAFVVGLCLLVAMAGTVFWLPLLIIGGLLTARSVKRF